MDKWRGKVAIVTGANSGIGAAIATALVREGVVVVGLDRQEDNIKSLADELSKDDKSRKLYSVKVDLRKEEDILAAFAWVERELGGADILVNNAGIITISNIADGETEDWRAMLEVNFLAVAICTREYLNSMDKRNNQTGHIVNIASLAVYVSCLQIAIYTATKHAVKAFSMCLRKELNEKSSNIKVTTVNPGAVKTNISKDRPTAIADMVSKMPNMMPEDIANVVVDALSTSNVTQICEVIVDTIPSPYMNY